MRAKDTKAGFGDPEEVAIKIIRNNDIMWVILYFLAFFYYSSFVKWFTYICFMRINFLLCLHLGIRQAWKSWSY